jgi:hypothetical protein
VSLLLDEFKVGEVKANQGRDEVGAWIDGGIWYGIVANASVASTRQLFATHLHTNEAWRERK